MEPASNSIRNKQVRRIVFGIILMGIAWVVFGALNNQTIWVSNTFAVILIFIPFITGPWGIIIFAVGVFQLATRAHTPREIPANTPVVDKESRLIREGIGMIAGAIAPFVIVIIFSLVTNNYAAGWFLLPFMVVSPIFGVIGLIRIITGVVSNLSRPKS